MPLAKAVQSKVPRCREVGSLVCFALCVLFLFKGWIVLSEDDAWEIAGRRGNQTGKRILANVPGLFFDLAKLRFDA